jgi:hypothetical protein
MCAGCGGWPAARCGGRGGIWHVLRALHLTYCHAVGAQVYSPRDRVKMAREFGGFPRTFKTLLSYPQVGRSPGCSVHHLMIFGLRACQIYRPRLYQGLLVYSTVPVTDDRRSFCRCWSPPTAPS